MILQLNSVFFHFVSKPLSCCKIIYLVGPRSSKLYFNVEPCQVQGPRGRSYAGCFYFVALKGWRVKVNKLGLGMQIREFLKIPDQV